jgi:hypothetical protein
MSCEKDAVRSDRVTTVLHRPRVFFLSPPPSSRSIRLLPHVPGGGGFSEECRRNPRRFGRFLRFPNSRGCVYLTARSDCPPEPFHVILEKSSVVVGVERCIEEPRGVPPSSSWTKRHPPNSGPVSHNIHIGQVSFQNAAGGFHPLQVHIERHRRIIQSPIHARQSFRLAGSSIETINASRHPPPAIAKTIAKLMRIM